jgi:hypothetical protein
VAREISDVRARSLLVPLDPAEPLVDLGELEANLHLSHGHLVMKGRLALTLVDTTVSPPEHRPLSHEITEGENLGFAVTGGRGALLYQTTTEAATVAQYFLTQLEGTRAATALDVPPDLYPFLGFDGSPETLLFYDPADAHAGALYSVDATSAVAVLVTTGASFVDR